MRRGLVCFTSAPRESVKDLCRACGSVAFFPHVACFSDGWHRRDVEIDYKGPHVSNYAFVAPSASLSGLVEVWDYASVWSDAVVRGDVRLVRIGAYSNIQVRRVGLLAGSRFLKKTGRTGR
jgi:hypothetical protein